MKQTGQSRTVMSKILAKNPLLSQRFVERTLYKLDTIDIPIAPATRRLAKRLLERTLIGRGGTKSDRMELIVCTCLHIASKFEEVYPYMTTEWCEIFDERLDPDDILSEELVILKLLDWRVIELSWLCYVVDERYYAKKGKLKLV